MKWILLLLFTVRVYIPFASDVIFKKVKAVEPFGRYYILTLSNNKIAYVPMMVTVIEED